MERRIETWVFSDKQIELFGEKIRQSWADLFFINRILSKYEFKNVIELGTGHGMLTVFIAMHCNCPLYSIEIGGEPRNKPYKVAKGNYTINFIRGDCFDNKITKPLSEIIKRGRTLIYCDNGNKKLELQTYAPFMIKDDVIMVHDKHKEVEWSEIREAVNKNKLKKFHQTESDYLNTSIWSLIKEE